MDNSSKQPKQPIDKELIEKKRKAKLKALKEQQIIRKNQKDESNH